MTKLRVIYEPSGRNVFSGCPFCSASIATEHRSRSRTRPGLCKPCVRMRHRIQCRDCGFVAVDYTRDRERCASCQAAHVEVMRAQRRARRTARANRNTVPVTESADRAGTMLMGELMCVECLKIKPVDEFKHGGRMCRRCWSMPRSPQRATTMAEAEGMR